VSSGVIARRTAPARQKPDAPAAGGARVDAATTVTLPAEGPALGGRLVVGGEGFEVGVPLPDGRVAGYGRGAGALLAVEPLAGNAFRPLHASDATLAALLSIAAGRRMETGPESERVLVFLRGAGFVFLQNGDALRFAPGDAALLPAGEPARVWAQGPEDVLAVVLQPQGGRAERRTLKGELEKRRQAAARAPPEP
jgi:quercetin dioxygenase-like cupin family protein